MEYTNVSSHNMGDEITIDEEKKALIEILDWVVDICEKCNIKYYLAEGTLLGAVRHKGFIPWDDDVDLIMLRPDYNRFVNVVKEFSNDRFFVAYSLEDSRHTRPFMRAYDCSIIVEETYGNARTYTHLNIDIFPSDGVPNNIFCYNLRCDIVRALIGLASIDMSDKVITGNLIKTIGKTLLYPIAKLIGFRKCYKLVDKIGSSLSIDNSDYIGVSVTPDCKKERIKKSKYLPQTLFCFEGKEYYGPKHYDEVLTNLYGDYMTPPPKDKQVQTHKRSYYKAN